MTFDKQSRLFVLVLREDQFASIADSLLVRNLFVVFDDCRLDYGLGSLINPSLVPLVC